MNDKKAEWSQFKLDLEVNFWPELINLVEGTRNKAEENKYYDSDYDPIEKVIKPVEKALNRLTKAKLIKIILEQSQLSVENLQEIHNTTADMPKELNRHLENIENKLFKPEKVFIPF